MRMLAVIRSSARFGFLPAISCCIVRYSPTNSMSEINIFISIDIKMAIIILSFAVTESVSSGSAQSAGNRVRAGLRNENQRIFRAIGFSATSTAARTCNWGGSFCGIKPMQTQTWLNKSTARAERMLSQWQKRLRNARTAVQRDVALSHVTLFREVI